MYAIPNLFALVDEEDEKSAETWPLPGSVSLVIKPVCVPLFFSAVWYIEASVDGNAAYKSNDYDREISTGEIRQWARALIRDKQFSLRRVGVDIEKLYVSFGGRKTDLTD